LRLPKSLWQNRFRHCQDCNSCLGSIDCLKRPGNVMRRRDPATTFALGAVRQDRGERMSARSLRVWPPVVVGLLAAVFTLAVRYLPAQSPPARHSEFDILAKEYTTEIRPLVQRYCQRCHGTKRAEGEVNLAAIKTWVDVRANLRIWQKAAEMLEGSQMPPVEARQPTVAERSRLQGWVRAYLMAEAMALSGDPGPVVLRRLSNAEYTYTLRDLTGVESLDPAREFPIDGAAGEGFTNTGNALVMSPSLLSKYLEAGKQVASHAVLLPDGFRFSPHTTRRDQTDAILAQIRAFYQEFTDASGGTRVNLQGIISETNRGGRLPLEKYLAVTLAERESLRTGAKTIEAVARQRGLNAKYLGLLWQGLSSEAPSFLLDGLRARWRTARPEDASALAAEIDAWQKELWRFTTVGHIGKIGGPKKWMEPVNPVGDKQEVRLKLPTYQGGEVTVSFVAAAPVARHMKVIELGATGSGLPEPVLASGRRGTGSEYRTRGTRKPDRDAALGAANDHDLVVWRQPRLVASGRPDLLLRDVRDVSRELAMRRERIFANTAKYLCAAAEAATAQGTTAALARKHGVETDALCAWLDYLGVGTGGPVGIEGYLAGKITSAASYDFIKGWGSQDTPLLVANSSGRHVRIPGNMKPHSVAVHPSPTLQAVVGWRSPVAAEIRIAGRITHAHPECGNGVTWSLELRRGATRRRLASGVAQGSKHAVIGPIKDLVVVPGDLVSILIGPRDGNHACDLTALELKLTNGGGRTWDLAADVSGDVLAGNPHADRFGNPAVWHFYTEPDKSGVPGPVIPAGSLLAKWQAAHDPCEQRKLADGVQRLLTSGPPGHKDSPDATLYQQLSSLGGPLFRGMLHQRARTGSKYVGQVFNLPRDRRQVENLPHNPARVTGDAKISILDCGPDPALFGKYPDGRPADEADLCVAAPSVVTMRLPADLVVGCELVTTGTLVSPPRREFRDTPHPNPGGMKTHGAASVAPVPSPPARGGRGQGEGGQSPARKLEVSRTTLSPSPLPLSPVPGERGDAAQQKPTAGSVQLRVLAGEVPNPPAFQPGSKVIVNEGTAARRRVESGFEEFRRLFPAALCYTRIVPVDEVVTLTLFYREDDHLARLMLDEAQQARLDRLWDELHYVSQDALTQVDAFAQLMEYATQDADPKVFEPLRRPINERAAAFRQRLIDSEPRHLAALLDFASRAYRRPLTEDERQELRQLYRRLREQKLSHEEAFRLTLARVLIAPAFLYRLERPGPGAEQRPVSDWELASRLSYFLWSSQPDAELSRAAERGRLHETDTLIAQARRMLREPRTRRLAIEFACQWLHIRDFDHLEEKSERHFPRFAGLRAAMYEESIQFFTDLFQRDGSVLDILDADYTFLNEALARHYGIPRVSGAGFHRVEGIKRYSRGGILGQATTLASQSGASRTSPILRGNWISEVLLGERLPRPPKDVPRLPEDETATAGLTVRQLVEKHSSDPRCAVCHQRIDAFGFSLEAFDAIGQRRDRDLGDRRIDTHAKTMDGEQFEDLNGLRHYLLTRRREAFVRQFCRKLLGYALGRGIQLSDEPLLAEMQARLKANGYHFTVAVEAIACSRQFREIRGQLATKEPQRAQRSRRAYKEENHAR
jgi:Protein of unknown function (DUF1592)/Protein of unknown function (DUF1588)/Protein of unknown function (DUF1587)/Protein of unknown function (DUF1585)/Protein of unknown function (DUF1595)